LKAGDERGKGQIMLSEEWLRMIQAERKREIEAARRAHEAMSAATPRSGVRSWLRSRFARPQAKAPVSPQTGRAATDLSA
jgi:hypothetical protein